MRWGRTLIVVTMMAIPLCIASAQPARAAPMTGVVFVTPARVFDSGNGFTTQPPGVVPIPFFGSIPTDATEALIQVTVITASVALSGVLMMHACGATPNPATDVAIPLQSGGHVVSNQVYVSTLGGVCMTTTAFAARIVVDVIAAVAPGGGAAYVDLPFAVAATVVGPVANRPIDFSTFGVPSDATGVALWVDALSTTAGFAVVHPCNQPASFAQADWLADEPSTSLVAGVASSGSGVCIDISDAASVDISIDGYYEVGATPTATSAPQVRWSQEAAPGFIGTSPTRLFDTRSSGVPIAGGQSYRLDVSPFVPADATAVVMNVTADQTSAAGFVTAYPCDGQQPATSSLNFEAGQTVPNLVTVDAGSTFEVCFFASVATHLLADLAGYYVFGAGDGFESSSPVRMLDTRGMASQIIGPAKVPGHAVFDFDASGFVAADASAIVFNLTATDVVGPGYVTAYPCGQQPPNASNLNVLAGQTVPNLVTVALDVNKHVCFFTTANINLIADLAGWYSPSAASGFISILPTRWADTRDLSDELIPAGSVYFVDFRQDFPEANAMVFNATATEPAAAGYLTAFPCGPDVPNASNVNFVAGQSVPNMAISAIDSFGRLCIFNSAETQWIVDVSGYFTDAPVFFAFFPDGTDIS